MLEVNELHFYERLRDINIKITAGRCLFLLGPNGCGKSTLLALLAGYQRATQGRYRLFGTACEQYEIHQLAKMRAWLPQTSPPPFAIPVYQFIALALHPLGLTLADSKVAEVVNGLVQRLDIAKFVSRNCDQLSGGEWQRVLIARTLLQVAPALNPQAKLCLLDEPLTGLDLKHQLELLTILSELAAGGMTVIASVHDLNLALNHASEILLLKSGQVAGQGSARQILTAATIKQVYDVDCEILQVQGRQFIAAVNSPD